MRPRLEQCQPLGNGSERKGSDPGGLRMQVVQRLLEGEDGELKVPPDHFWPDRNLGVHLRIVLERIHGEADPFIANRPHDHVLPGIRDVSNWDLQDNLGGVGQKCLHSHELAKFAVALAPFQGALRVAQVVGIKEVRHIVLDLLQFPKCSFILGPVPRLGDFTTKGISIQMP